MMFTILNDARQSLVCNDCLTDDRLDTAYSECSDGSCDECGYTNLLTGGVGLLVVCLFEKSGSQWVSDHSIPNATLVTTDDDMGKRALEGRMIAPGHIMLLPEAERGRCFGEVERRLEMVTSGILVSNVKISNNIQPLQTQINTLQQKLGGLNVYTSGAIQSFQQYGVAPASNDPKSVVAITGSAS